MKIEVDGVWYIEVSSWTLVEKSCIWLDGTRYHVYECIAIREDSPEDRYYIRSGELVDALGYVIDPTENTWYEVEWIYDQK